MKTTRRTPRKKKFLEKFVTLEASPSQHDQSLLLLDVWKKLWEHQRKGALFTLKRKKNFLAMDIGTGKTLTTLASLQKRHVRGSVDTVLIICSASAVHTWETEIAQWLPGTSLKFVIVSYSFARFYYKFLKKELPDAVVMDEIHRLKNPNSGQGRRVAKAIAKVSIRYGLTGEQIADTTIDLFSQYRAVDPSILGDHWPTFREHYLTRGGFMGHELRISEQNKRKILRMVEPITYQVLKTDVLDVKIAPPVVMYTELKGTQKKLYQDLAGKMVAHHDGFTISTVNEISQMIRLQQITGGHVPDDDGNMLTFECGKIDLLKELLSTWNRKKKLVIFARFIHELGLIQQTCEKMKFSSYIYSPKKAYIDDEFQKNDHPQISISQIQSGSESRTLVRSSTPVFFSKTFSYMDYTQGVGRVYRGGQKELVTPILLTTRGTIDEDLDESVRLKQGEAQFVKMFISKLKTRI